MKNHCLKKYISIIQVQPKNLPITKTAHAHFDFQFFTHPTRVFLPTSFNEQIHSALRLYSNHPDTSRNTSTELPDGLPNSPSSMRSIWTESTSSPNRSVKQTSDHPIHPSRCSPAHQCYNSSGQ